MQKPAVLVLGDGSVFLGVSIGVDGHTVGEVVFNTAMTGYQEILTDPSYSRQIVTLTYPHIGNTGVNPEDQESARVHAAGLVIRDLPLLTSNWRCKQTLPDYLKENGIVAISEVDTRRLTRLLREKGAQSGCIIAGAGAEAKRALQLAREFPGLVGMDLAKEVTVSSAYQWTEGTWRLGEAKGQMPRGATGRGPGESGGGYHVVAYDFGVKHNILRMLADRGCRITVVPAKTPAAEALALNPDGVFLSNGPGDPEPCTYATEAIREFMKVSMPVFGICLGHQLLGLACGARTHKMKFGHHGANHPVQELATGRVLITSQNHGFAVDEKTLPPNVKATHRSLFDGSLQGIHATDKPAFSFQGHPEASPGPHDIGHLFDHFIELMDAHAKANVKRHAKAK